MNQTWTLDNVYTLAHYPGTASKTPYRLSKPDKCFKSFKTKAAALAFYNKQNKEEKMTNEATQEITEAETSSEPTTTDRMTLRIPVALEWLATNHHGTPVWDKIALNIGSTEKSSIRLVLTANELDTVFRSVSNYAMRRIAATTSPEIRKTIRASRRMVLKLWESGHKFDGDFDGVIRTSFYAEKKKRGKKNDAE